MKILAFGQLEPVDIRCCWLDEARDFTLWLATPEGIALLAASLGLELAVEGKEVPVGPYNADILARDLTTDALVVIENQLEKTNHDHLGKSLTYAAILGASSVVWIARTFTEEHRKAIEWLNELTKGDLLVYGVELQVWKIANSLPAPRFEVVCGPNEIVRQATIARDTVEELSDTRQLQRPFWTEVRQGLERTGKFRSLQTPRPQYWFDIALGRAHIHLSLIANTFDKQVGVKIYLGHQVADLALKQLIQMREEIEQEIGAQLDWNPLPEKRDKVIKLLHPGDISDRSQWPQLVDWLAKTAVAFKNAFGPRIAELDLSSSPLAPEDDNLHVEDEHPMIDGATTLR